MKEASKIFGTSLKQFRFLYPAKIEEIKTFQVEQK
jgi:hypothetical protein